MSFHEAFAWTLLRSVAATTLAVPMSICLSQLVQQTTGRSRFWWMLFVLCPLVAPDLIIGYGYRSFELSLLHRPVLNHCFYFVLILLKILPAAAVIRICSPPAPVSKAAFHCARLIECGVAEKRQHRPMRLNAELLRHIPVCGIVFLLSMQEFEIASLLQIPAWTVHVFDAQASGLNMAATLKLLFGPVLLQAVILVPLLWWGLANSAVIVPRWRSVDCAAGSSCCLGVIVASLAVLLTWVIPLAFVTRSGLSGIGGVLENQVLLQSTFLDLATAIALTIPCAVLSLVLARKVIQFFHGYDATQSDFSKAVSSVPLLLTVVPGLFGSLVVSVAILVATQHAALLDLRTTAWPMAAALVICLVPRATILVAVLPVFRSSESAFLATLLGKSRGRTRLKNAAELKWWCECRPMFLVTAVLFYWCLANLTAAAILCPPTIPLFSFDGNVVPLPVRLYKFIHQGRTAALSVMAVLSVLVPFVLLVLTSQVAPQVYLRMTSHTRPN
jgi:ABC-type Fe3+ transport system permease subunit